MYSLPSVLVPSLEDACTSISKMESLGGDERKLQKINTIDFKHGDKIELNNEKFEIRPSVVGCDLVIIHLSQ